MCEALEAEQLCLLLAKLKNLLYYGLVVVLVVVVAAAIVCLVNLLAQSTVVGILQERYAAGLVKREDPALAVLACSGINHALRQACKVGLVGYFELECLVVGKEVCAELDLRKTNPGVDVKQFRLVLGIQQRTATYKTLVIVFKNNALLLVKAQALFCIVYCTNAVEKSIVHEYVTAKFGHLRNNILFNLRHLRSILALIEVEEYRTHLVERSSAHFKSIDSIGVCRSIAVFNDSLYVGTLLLKPAVERLLVILNLELVELRSPERSIALLENAVALLFLLRCTCKLCQHNR